MTRHVKRGGKIWIRIFPDKPITKKPAETRMGTGKGGVEDWVAVVKPGPHAVRDRGRGRGAGAARRSTWPQHKLPVLDPHRPPRGASRCEERRPWPPPRSCASSTDEDLKPARDASCARTLFQDRLKRCTEPAREHRAIAARRAARSARAILTVAQPEASGRGGEKPAGRGDEAWPKTTEQTGADRRRRADARRAARRRIGIVTSQQDAEDRGGDGQRRARRTRKYGKYPDPAREVQGARRGQRLPKNSRQRATGSHRRDPPDCRRTSAGAWSRCSSAARARRGADDHDSDDQRPRRRRQLRRQEGVCASRCSAARKRKYAVDRRHHRRLDPRGASRTPR